MRQVLEPDQTDTQNESLKRCGEIRPFDTHQRIEFVQPHTRLTSNEFDLPSGLYWLQCSYSPSAIISPPRLGIFCQNALETHVIGVDLDRKDRLLELVGGRVQFEMTPYAYPGNLYLEELTLRPMSGVRWINFSLRRGLGKLLPNTGVNKLSEPQGLAFLVDERKSNVHSQDSWLVHETGYLSFSPSGHELLSVAEDLVSKVFDTQSETMAVYGDNLIGAAVHGLPDWDPILAATADYVEGAVFVRESAKDLRSSSGMEALKAAERLFGSGAIHHIPVPLSRAALADGVRSRPSVPCPDHADWPSVSIVIPTKIRLDLLALCLNGLAKQTDYPRKLEVIIVDNGAEPQELEAVIAKNLASLDIRIIDRSGPFNFSYLVNQGVAQAQGEIVVLLNDDVVPISPTWLKRIVDSAMDERVGAVGARLLNKDGTIQHAGVALGLCGLCGHMWRGLSDADAQHYPSILAPSRRSAVTGACLAVRRSLYHEAGGFDEADLQVTLNDIDFCLRLNGMGYQTLYRGDAVLIHDESSSRGADIDIAKLKRRAAEIETFQTRWNTHDVQDPWFSPYFDRYSESGL